MTSYQKTRGGDMSTNKPVPKKPNKPAPKKAIKPVQKKAEKRPACAKFRLPDESIFMALYHGDEGYWEGTLRIGNSSYSAKAKGIHHLFNLLGKQWKKEQVKP